MSITQERILFNSDHIYFYHNVIDSSKDTIVMLHPAFGDHEIFDRQVDFFEQKFNLLLVDMPGHGLSNHVKKTHVGHTPEIIKLILEYLSISRVHLLGVSMGSLVAQGIADKYPEMIESVTLIGGYSIHDNNEDVLKSQRKEMFKWLFLILFNMKKFRSYIVDVSVSSDLGKEKMRKGVNHFTRASFRAMSGMNQIFRKTSEEKIYPLLALVGEYDLPLAHETSKRLGNKRNGIFHEIKNAGHCANIDQHNEFNQYYLNFIRSLV